MPHQGTHTGEYIAEQIAPLLERLDALEALSHLTDPALISALAQLNDINARVGEIKSRLVVLETALSNYDGEVLIINGDIGPVGATGPIGETGPVGATGLTGLAGIDGVDGMNGADGVLVGPMGATGDTGAQGIAGVDGTHGVDGANGVDGTDGIDGVDGVDGSIGLTGPVGPAGYSGVNGQAGVAGPTGAQGIAGPQGDIGPIGPMALPVNNDRLDALELKNAESVELYKGLEISTRKLKDHYKETDEYVSQRFSLMRFRFRDLWESLNE